MAGRFRGVKDDREADPPDERWQLVASGRVQGVGYRARVAAAARRLGITGSVANRPDGTVVIDAQGPVGALGTFVEQISGALGSSDARSVRRVAPPAAPVAAQGFEVR